MTKLRIADFSEVPAGRFRTDGPFSGQRFREEVLLPILQQPGQVEVRIDGTAGYGSSFLEEAFGGLVRSGFTPAQLRQRLVIRTDDPSFRTYEDQIWRFIDRVRVVEAHVA